MILKYYNIINMGVWTEFDALINNPAIFYSEYDETETEESVKKYSWQKKVRCVLLSGEVTSIGYYNKSGYVIVGKKKYKLKNINGDEQGYIITDYTYQSIVKHKSYKKSNNLYSMIKLYKNYKNRINTGPPAKYIRKQEVWFDHFNNDNANNTVIIGKTDWAFINPNLDLGYKNKLRINNIIDDFMKFSHEIQNKQNNIVTHNFEKDGNFWQIKYDEINGGYVKIMYGKIIEKRETLAKIRKLIETKVKSGYVKKLNL